MSSAAIVFENLRSLGQIVMEEAVSGQMPLIPRRYWGGHPREIWLKVLESIEAAETDKTRLSLLWMVPIRISHVELAMARTCDRGAARTKIARLIKARYLRAALWHRRKARSLGQVVIMLEATMLADVRYIEGGHEGLAGTVEAWFWPADKPYVFEIPDHSKWR